MSDLVVKIWNSIITLREYQENKFINIIASLRAFILFMFMVRSFLNYSLGIGILLLWSGVAMGALIYSPTRDLHFNPLQFYVNGTFDVTQNPNYFNQKDFFEKHATLFRRIRHPGRSMEDNGGWKKFVKYEIIGDRVIPNIFLHTLGSGHDMRMLKEYFEYKEIPGSTFWAIGLTYLVHLGNEALETTSPRIHAHDHLADLFFFDVLAIPLFLNDQWARYLVEEWGMRPWHFQPIYLIKEEDFTNAGLNYIFRPPSVRGMKGRLQPFIMFGMQVLGGVTFKLDEETGLSWGSGMAYTDPIEGKGRWAHGLFYEKGERLASSLLINSTENYRIRLNLYPQLLAFGDHSLGVMGAYQKGNHWVMGLQYQLPLGVGMTF